MTNCFMIQPLMLGQGPAAVFFHPTTYILCNSCSTSVVRPIHSKAFAILNSHNNSHTSRMYKTYTEFASVVSDDRMIA